MTSCPSRFVIVVSVLLLSACALREAPPEVVTDYDPGTDFNGYQTFAWMSAHPLLNATSQPVTPNLEKNLMDETAAQLSAQGYRKVATPAEADFVVSFVIGTRSSLQVNAYPGRYRPPGNVGGSYHESSEVREVTTGAISIEFFNQQTAQRIWTGWATTGLTMDVRANAEETTREMVQLILEQFPPGSDDQPAAG